MLAFCYILVAARKEVKPNPAFISGQCMYVGRCVAAGVSRGCVCVCVCVWLECDMCLWIIFNLYWRVE